LKILVLKNFGVKNSKKFKKLQKKVVLKNQKKNLVTKRYFFWQNLNHAKAFQIEPYGFL